jgi:hypothetical protein
LLGKFTAVALSIIPSFNILNWLILSPNGFYPKSISKYTTPIDHISTFGVITAFLEVSKHSGGKYQ